MLRVSLALLIAFVAATARAEEPRPYPEIVLEDGPAAYWRFDGDARLSNVVSDSGALSGAKSGRVTLGEAGPRSESYPGFTHDNTALRLRGRGGYVKVTDPGAESPLDFTTGEAITIEAWVNPERVANGRTAYVLGKGRTGRKGFASDNQNYALRVLGKGSRAGLSFLFRGAANRGGNREDWHRWDSKGGFPVDGRWHHVAVTYVFGQPDSIRGYVDGKPVEGAWNDSYGGPTEAGPVVDDDELWIGSSMGGSAGSTFEGWLDEVALHRKVVPAERMALRYRAVPPKPYFTKADPPAGGVRVELFEQAPESSDNVTNPVLDEPATTWTARAFGFPAYPEKYDAKGLRAARKLPMRLRAAADVTLPEGEYELLLRCRGDARLYVDDEELVHVPRLKLSGNAHGHVVDARQIKDHPNLHPLWAGDNERLVPFTADGQTQRFRLEMVLGERNRRPDVGETSIAFRKQGTETFFLLAPDAEFEVPLTDEGWYAYRRGVDQRIAGINRRTRFEKSAEERAYWAKRHEIARRELAKREPVEVPEAAYPDAINNEIDRFVNAKLQAEGKRPHGVVDDWAFLRRVTLDVVGTVPTEEQVRAFFADDSPDRRARYVERLLEEPGWADHWVAYWQDVLAENPNVLKPTLNNTGPFRWWIHEAFSDNRPFDRFVTELVLMEGGQYVGGPGGFAMATQNDVPMAAKAHVVGQAFLGLEMQCARCHDAPFHDFTQKDLFSLAAMLGRSPQGVPKSSSVPGAEASNSLLVTVTLKPGTKVAPEWAFSDVAPAELPEGVLRNPNDPRERAAALLTSPRNDRFARVAVNRMWHRYLGRGIVEPVDDWEQGEASHPELLDYLGRELVRSGYDLKHVARLILTSHTYQREVVPVKEAEEADPYLFAGPVRRRMTAEQLLDSLFVAAGKDFNASELNFDVDTTRPYQTFLNLGRPQRAWEFTSLSNERDRPSLSLPFAQDFVSLLETFGWRSSRQNPVTERESQPTVLQPAIMANGVVTGRVTRLSDDGELTEVALEEQPVERLVERLYVRFLTREPTSEERELFAGLLEDGYGSREAEYDPRDVVRFRARPSGVSWSNHLSPEANAIKLELEAMVRKGDPPSVRLEDDWRRRAEDVVWTLVNTPEFVFVP